MTGRISGISVASQGTTLRDLIARAFAHSNYTNFLLSAAVHTHAWYLDDYLSYEDNFFLNPVHTGYSDPSRRLPIAFGLAESGRTVFNFVLGPECLSCTKKSKLCNKGAEEEKSGTK